MKSLIASNERFDPALDIADFSSPLQRHLVDLTKDLNHISDYVADVFNIDNVVVPNKRWVKTENMELCWNEHGGLCSLHPLSPLAFRAIRNWLVHLCEAMIVGQVMFLSLTV